MLVKPDPQALFIEQRNSMYIVRLAQHGEEILHHNRWQVEVTDQFTY